MIIFLLFRRMVSAATTTECSTRAQPIRTKTMASGGPQPISVECSSIKPQWFWLGFVESTHLIGLLLGFIEIAWFL